MDEDEKYLLQQPRGGLRPSELLKLMMGIKDIS